MPEGQPTVEKAQIDIDLNGGLDESKPEEAIEWNKSFSNVENLVNDGGAYSVRKGAVTLATTDSDSATIAPIHRLVAMPQGVGLVGNKYQLYHLNEAAQSLRNKGRMPEFGVSAKPAGNTAPPIVSAAGTVGGSRTGVVGVGFAGSYYMIAYVGESPTIYDPAAPSDTINYSVLYIDLIDPTSSNIIKSYTWTAAGSERRFSVICVDARYIHVFETDLYSSTSKPRMFVIDSQSLPAGPALSPSWTEFTSSAFGDSIAGVCAISGASVAIISSSSTNRIEKFNNSGASVSSAAVTGFTRMTGIDTDGTNFYISGRLLGLSDPGAGLTLTGWYKASYGGSPWTSSEGASNMTEATNPPSVGTAVNGFTPASFDNTNDQLTNTTAIPAAAGTFVVLCKPNTSSGKQIVGESTAANRLGIKMSANSGFVFSHFNGTNIATLNVPFPPGRWAMVAARWDGTTMSMKVNKGEWVYQSRGAANSPGNMKMGGTTGCDCQILEVIHSDSALTNGNIEDILEYLESRYALTL